MLRGARLWDCMSSVRLSARPSVMIRYRDQIGWNSSKIISRPNRPMRSLTPNMGDLVQREHPTTYGPSSSCPAFSCPAFSFSCAAISCLVILCLAISCPANLSIIFTSSIFSQPVKSWKQRRSYRGTQHDDDVARSPFSATAGLLVM